MNRDNPANSRDARSKSDGEGSLGTSASFLAYGIASSPTFEQARRFPYKALFFSMILAASVLITLKSIGDYQSSRERGRFVVSMLRENRAEMQKHFHLAQFDLPHSGAHGSLKTAALQAWLYQQIFQNNRPSIISKELTAFNQAGSYGPSSQILIKRWNEALGRWDKSLSDGVSGRFSVNPVERGKKYDILPETLFEQARLHYYEASGYQKIGRKFDASVLYLWSSELLSQFIQLNPSSPDVPQALFLLGASQVRMRTAFNPEIRSDRLLNLCVELYPDSIWATLARELRREEFGYAV